MNNCGIKSSLDCFREKNRVENYSSCWLETKRYIADSKGCLNIREFPLEFPDCLDRLFAIFSGFFLTSCNGKCQTINQNVSNVHTPITSQIFDQSRCNLQFPFSGPGLSLFINC